MAFISAAKRFAGFLACAALLGASPWAQAVPGVFIYYSPSTIVQGGTAVLGIQFSDQDGGATGFTGGFLSPTAFNYPAQVVNTGTVSSNSCTGSVVVATPGASTFSVAGVTVPTAFGNCIVEIQVATTAPGSYLTTFPAGGFTASTGTSAATPSATLVSNAAYLVTNTNDSGPGSLRDAITQANYPLCNGLMNIQFAISGTGPFTIQPLTQLPALGCANMTIDGSSQPGFTANTDAGGGNNSAIQIVLDGSLCTGGCDGLELNAPSVFVRGLAIHSFALSGIAVGTGSASIYGNYIGTDPGGMTALGNATAGVTVLGGFANVGSSSPQDRNLISANATGVWIGGNGTASIENNQVGGKRDGSAGNGNVGRGILFNLVTSSSSNVDGNYVRYNGRAGIVLDSGTSGRVTILGNSSYANGGPGIDYNDDGPTPNDGATDNVLDYPVITQVAHSGTDTIVSGTLLVPEAAGVINGAPATIELYHNSVASSQTEGEQLIDVFNVRLDATGFISFTRTIPGFLADNVTAATTVDTCGDGCVHSSEYSPKVAVTNPLVVTNTSDSGPGSLRDAISFVNANCGAPSTITFNIPVSGLQTIAPLSALPAITCDGTYIDGFSQPGARSNETGNDAVRLIEIDGRLAGIANGLEVRAGSVTIRGLIIDNFQQLAGILVDAFSGTTGIQILGNVLGDPTGTRFKKNSIGVDEHFPLIAASLAAKRGAVSGKAASSVRLAIGSAALGDRNVISGNDIGIRIGSSDTSVIQNNYIGTDVSGVTATGNDTGISASAGIGGLVITGNVIGGNLNDGVTLWSGSSVLVLGNFIGTNPAGATTLGNAFAGVNVKAGVGAQIGSVAPGDGNVIAFNGGDGVQVQSTGIAIRGNSIYQNKLLGINLVGQTPTLGQDACDADSGANNWQNYPVVTSATAGSGIIAVAGTLNSTDLTSFQIDVYSSPAADTPSEHSGHTYVGSIAPPTTSGCTTSWSASFPFAGAVGDLVTATATDPSGNTSWFSLAVPVVSATTVPGAPIIGVATAGNAQATVTFAPPASNGGSPITSYVVTSSPSGITASGTGSPITVTGLVNGTTYTFSVVAINVVGPGPASAASNAVTPAAAAPSVGLTPGGLTFAARTVSTTSPAQTVTLTNGGAGPLAISSITISGDFAFTSTCGATVPAGGTCTISVTFTPLATGTRTGTLTIASSAPGSPHSVALSGAGQVASAAIAQVVPSTGDFPPQELGTTSAGQLFVITNVGNATLVFSDITVTGTGFTLQPTVTSPNYQRCGPTILSGAVCAVAVTFSPPAAGSFAGLLHIASNATNSPVDVGLQGSGVVTAPARALSVPSSLAFPDQAVGTQSDGRPVPITNNSASAVSITGLTTSGDFAVSDTCTTIAAHTTCSPLVTFSPTALGARSGTLSIHALSETAPYLVDLTGNGVFSEVPQISLSVTRLGFGNTLIGAPVTAHVTLTNVGTVPVNLQSVLARAQFLVSETCPFTIPVRGTCDISISFFPNMVGSVAGTIEIATNAAGSPHDVQVSGVGCAIPSVSRIRSGQPICGQ